MSRSVRSPPGRMPSENMTDLLHPDDPPKPLPLVFDFSPPLTNAPDTGM